jgi:hypothetical protein
MMHSGYFYKCMRPPTTREYLLSRGMNGGVVDFEVKDGVSLKSTELYERIEEYMTEQRRLQSCHYCLKGFERSYEETTYTRFKGLFRENRLLRRLVFSNAWLTALTRKVNKHFEVPIRDSNPRVPIHIHEMMNRDECKDLNFAPHDNGGFESP